jgi:hypothetical protein
MLYRLALVILGVIAAATGFSDVSSVNFDRNTVVADGAPIIATVTLDAPAGVGGMDVTLAHSTGTSCQTTLHIDEGFDSNVCSFYPPFAVNSTQEIWLSAGTPGQEFPAFGNGIVKPLIVTGCTCGLQPQVCGGYVDLTIKLNGTPADGVDAALTSSDPNVTFFSTNIAFNPFQRSRTVRMYFPDNAAASSTVTITLDNNGQVYESTPFYPRALRVSGLTAGTTFLPTETDTICTVTLNGVQRVDTVVTLSSGTYLDCPTSVTVLAGQLTATFTLSAKHTRRDRIETVRAAVNGLGISLPINIQS